MSNKYLRLSCWESVFERGIIEGDCPVCQCSKIRYKSTTGTTFQKMHIIPLSKGGATEAWNLLPGCGCNQNMSTMNLVDWMGTRGNKQSLIKSLFLSKYKSLVPEIYRSETDDRQLVRWITERYHPSLLNFYRDWLVLTKKDLFDIFSTKSHYITSPYFTRGIKFKKIRLGNGPPRYYRIDLVFPHKLQKSRSFFG